LVYRSICYSGPIDYDSFEGIHESPFSHASSISFFILCNDLAGEYYFTMILYEKVVDQKRELLEERGWAVYDCESLSKSLMGCSWHTIGSLMSSCQPGIGAKAAYGTSA